MKNKLFIFIGISIAVATASCRKYVEIPTEGYRILENTADYKALLDNSLTMSRTYQYPLYSSDEAGSTNVTWENGIANNANGNAYIWAEKIMTSNASEDADWTNMYSSIYVTNQIIVNVMNSKNGTEAEKRSVFASALVHRAYYYLTLVNLYAKQYNAATAATDLGVPMRLDDLSTGSLDRKSVATVYNQILSDLNQAISFQDLRETPGITTDASKASAYALLARTYLNMRNFPEAAKAADSSLRRQSTLLNLNNYFATGTTTNYPQRHVDPEILLCKMAGASGLPLSDAQIAAIPDTAKDLRYQILTKPGAVASQWTAYLTRVYFKTYLPNQGYVAGPTVPEVMLIKAECEARAGNAANAMAVLNTLRKTRFKPADYTDLTITDPALALQRVIAERRIELMGTGMRWFDLRRLAADGLTPTLTRVFKGATYTLAPGSNRYTFAIADRYIQLSPEIEQNPR